jgi:hypothetical protein
MRVMASGDDQQQLSPGDDPQGAHDHRGSRARLLINSASVGWTPHHLHLVPRPRRWCQVASGRAREGAHYPVTKDTRAMQVTPNPTDNL